MNPAPGFLQHHNATNLPPLPFVVDLINQELLKTVKNTKVITHVQLEALLVGQQEERPPVVAVAAAEVATAVVVLVEPWLEVAVVVG